MKPATKGPRILVTHRSGALILERARVHVQNGRVVYFSADDREVQSFNIPHVNLAVLFLGQGTSITQEAARLLSEESVYVAFSGTGGTPIHYGSLISYQSTTHFRNLLPIYIDDAKSLKAARSVMRDRCKTMADLGVSSCQKFFPEAAQYAQQLEIICGNFSNKLDAYADIQALLGGEGAYSRNCYKLHAGMVGISPDGEKAFKRFPGGDPEEKDRFKKINSLIDHGNYLAYGIAGAALWALGIPPHLSVFHGKTRAGGLVFDLADSFKDALVLPRAFYYGYKAETDDSERDFRADIVNTIDDNNLLAYAISVVERMIDAGNQNA